MVAMADGLGTMTPDSSEGRERITRLESRVEDIKSDVERNERTFGPLPLAVERLQWTIDAINARLDKRDHADDERFQKFERSVGNQFAACSAEIGKVAETMRQHHEADQKRRDEARRKREQEERDRAKDAETTKLQQFVAKWGAAAVLGGALIASVTSIVIAFFGGGG